MKHKLKSRKFLLTLLCIIVAFIFVFEHDAHAPTVFTFIAGVLSFYSGANVVQKKNDSGK